MGSVHLSEKPGLKGVQAAARECARRLDAYFLSSICFATLSHVRPAVSHRRVHRLGRFPGQTPGQRQQSNGGSKSSMLSYLWARRTVIPDIHIHYETHDRMLPSSI